MIYKKCTCINDLTNSSKFNLLKRLPWYQFYIYILMKYIYFLDVNSPTVVNQATENESGSAGNVAIKSKTYF